LKRVLVVGFGSIGMRHARLLGQMGLEVAVVSRRAVDFSRVYGTIEQGLNDFLPDYVVVASRTNEHAEDFRALARLGFDGVVLMEKPLFGTDEAIPENRFSRCHVAYNLRFHPVVLAFRDRLADLRPITVSAYCGQYLPDWRPHTDYRQGYSAIKGQGGGVLRDLSHELDYMGWMLGEWTRMTAIGGHFSHLEVDSDDCFALLMQTSRAPIATVCLNYLDTRLRREIVAITDTGTLRADLPGGLVEWRGEAVGRFTVERDDTYIAQHRAVIEGDETILCSLTEGKATIRLIAAAERAAAGLTWIGR
jgi:predicted dehydrogenase